MKRSYLHLLIDTCLFLGAVGLILTGLLMEFVLPSGSRNATVWGLTRHDWGDLHFWIAMVILAAGLLHLLLNWGWVCSVCAKLLRLDSSKPTLRRQLWTGTTTAAVLAVLVGGFLFAADAGKVEDSGGRGLGGGRGQGELEHELEDLFLDGN
jgi:hypothetical protein